MKALVVLAVGLGVPGVLPALVVARRWAPAVFLAPLIGAGLAAVAAVIELGLGGSLPVNYAVLAAIANLAVIAWWRMGRYSVRSWTGPSWGWSVATVAVALGCLVIPLTALRSPMIGWDANTMWLTKALMAYGGHHELVTGLQNPAYQTPTRTTRRCCQPPARSRSLFSGLASCTCSLT
jgi:uncharacterized membrane protein